MDEQNKIPIQPSRAVAARSARPRWRRWVLLGGGLVGGMLVVLLLLPWWFPSLTRVVLRQVGVEVEQANRQGVSRMELRGIRYHDATLRLEVGRMELPLPGSWLSWWMQTRRAHAPALIQVTGWTLALEATEPRVTVPEPPSWSATVDQVSGVLAAVRRWLPPASLESGRIEVPGFVLDVPRLAVDAGAVESVLHLAEPGVEAELRLVAPLDHRFELGLRVRPGVSDAADGFNLGILFALDLDVEAERLAGGWTLQAKGQWLNNPLSIAVDLAPDEEGVWARSVSLELPALAIPASAFGLTGYDSLGGRLWVSGPARSPAFDLALWSEVAEVDWPAVRVTATGQVNTRELELATCRVEVAGLGWTLIDPLRWGWAPPGLRAPTSVDVRADLDGQPYLPLNGRIEGRIGLTPRSDVWPAAVLALSGYDLECWGQAVAEFSVDLRAAGARIERAEAGLRTPDGSRVVLTAEGVDLMERTLGQAQLRAEVTDALAVLPEGGPAFAKAAMGLTVRGDLAAARHEGWMQAEGIRVPGLRELSLAVDWQGDSDRWIQFRPRLSTDHGMVTALALLTNRTEVALSELRMEGRDIEPLALRTPAWLVWQREEGESEPTLTLRLDRLDLGNAQQSIELEGAVAWPVRGDARLLIQGLDTAVLAPFVERDLPAVRLDSLGAEARWNDGPVEFGLRFAGRHTTPLLGSLRFAGAMAGDAEGLTVERLRLGEADSWWASATGAIPCQFRLTTDGPAFELGTNAPMHLEAELDPSPLALRWLEQQFRTRTDNARARVTVRGSPTAPEGDLRVTVGQVTLLGESTNTWALPPVRALDLHVTMQPEAVRVEGFGVEIEGRPLVGRGELPLPAGFWESVWQGDRELDLQAASGHLQLADFPLALLPPELLQAMRPEGSVRADLRLEPGGKVRGEVTLEGLATRALPMTGPIRGIGGRVRLEDREVEIQSIRADVGGAAAELNGVVDLAPLLRRRESLPGVDLRLTGERLPLARQAGLVIRSDLDLRLQRAPGETPRIQGAVTLQRSFVLSDLEALFGGTVRTAARPPPYFTVEKEPLAGCRLDIAIRADETVHVRSPFYRGSHSLNLRLRGTLRDPLLTGDVQVGRASVIFPYASMPVSQGLVTFTEQNPEAPRLVVTAASRAFGYDLRMEVGGTLQEPSLQLSSLPSLTSEEILLMVTAGELPRNELQYTTQDRLAKLATLVGKDLLAKFGAQDATKERLIMRSGEGISAGGRVTHQIEYRFNDVWSMVGEYDEFDDLNAGIKWRIIRR